MNLNDFIDPELSTADVIHSSGYASASGAGAIGGASGGGLSIEQRREKLNGPRVVGSYQQSDIGRRTNFVKARTADQKEGRIYDASNDTFDDRAKFSNRRPGGVSVDKADRSIERRQRFIEPPARNHNPFA